MTLIPTERLAYIAEGLTPETAGGALTIPEIVELAPAHNNTTSIAEIWNKEIAVISTHGRLPEAESLHLEELVKSSDTVLLNFLAVAEIETIFEQIIFPEIGIEFVTGDGSLLLHSMQPQLDVCKIELFRPRLCELGAEDFLYPVGIEGLHTAIHPDERVERWFDGFDLLLQRGFTPSESHDSLEVFARAEPFDISGFSAVTIYSHFELVARALS